MLLSRSRDDPGPVLPVPAGSLSCFRPCSHVSIQGSPGAINMSYFSHHVFFCTNQRTDGRESCAACGASGARAYVKDRIKALGLSGQGRVRINDAGCLDRCSEGPVLVIYPEETWYTYVDREDLDEIIDSHLVQGKIVDRLKI